MVKVKKYLHRYFGDKRTAFGSLLTVILFCSYILVFLRYAPWLTAHDIELVYDRFSYKGVAPEWARSFSINHGDYIFYRDSPRENRFKFYTIIFLLLVLFFLSGLTSEYFRKIRKRNDTEKKHESADE